MNDLITIARFWAINRPCHFHPCDLKYPNDPTRWCPSCVIAGLLKYCDDFDKSHELYHRASMSLMHAYKRAHPEVPENIWPDVTKVSIWAAELIEKMK